MAKKYRIKLKKGRIVGPFEIEELGSLYSRGHISGNEEIQVFPTGEWLSIEDFPDAQKVILKEITRKENEDSVIDEDKTIARIRLGKKRREELAKGKVDSKEKRIEKVKEIEEVAKRGEFQEFKFKKEESPRITYEELEESHAKKKEQKKKSTETEEVEESADLDKTRIIKRNSIPVPSKEVDKTIILKSNTVKKLKKEEVKEEAEEEIKEEEQIEEEIDSGEKTEFINLKALIPSISNEAEEIESKLEEIKKEKELALTVKKEVIEDEIEDFEDKKDTKKKLKPIAALAILVIFYFVLFDKEEDTDVINPIYTKVSSPVVKNKANPKKSEKLFIEGLRLYDSGVYKQLIVAASKFKESVEYEFEGNEALGFLLLTYARLYPNIRNKKKAAQVLFRLVKITRAKAVKNVQIAMGTSLFYLNNGKVQTALNVLENYLRVAKKPTITFYSLYLKTLIISGDLIRAKKIQEKVEEFPKKSDDAYLALSQFYELDEKYEKSKKIVLEGLKKNPTNIPLLLSLAGHFLREQDFKRYSENLKVIENLKAEESPAYYSKFLEYMGILSAYNKDNKTAVFLFKLALKINPTDTLISKLGQLEIGGSSVVKGLILESKALDLIRKSQKLAKLNKWEGAFKAALEASDLNQNFIPAQTNLARLQVKRGYFEYAIVKLEEIRKEYPNNPTVLFDLVNAFIASKKKSDSRGLVSAISNSKLKQHRRYNGMLGKYYFSIGRYKRAVTFFNRSTEKSPLRDEDYYIKAKIFMKSRQYKRASVELSEAINLDPLNIQYQSLYAKILFELNGASVAIGYLQDLLKDNRDHPKILGDIAIYYYNEGKIGEFEAYKKQIASLSTKSPDFYRFLVDSAILEDKPKAIISAAEKLLEIEPGNVEMRMLLGKYQYNTGLYRESLRSFDNVLKRLQTYPAASYFKAKVYIALKQYKKALAAGKKEIENNPNLYHGYYITGETERLLEHYPEALKNLETAVSKDPRSIESLVALGWIKWRQNYLDLALEYYKRAKRQDEANPEIRKQLGNIYSAIGQGAVALEEFETYLNLYPNAPDRQQIQSRVNQLKR